MTVPAAPAVPAVPAVPCPSCGAPLTGAPTCAGCGIRLTGPEAQRLWQVDQSLLALDGQRTQLMAERRTLLAILRGESTPGTAGSLAAPPAPRSLAPAAPTDPPWPVRPAAAAPEWTPQRVQNTLLGLGALLLGIAATVFAAVTYDRLGATGRAAVLVAITLLALAAVPPLLRKGLTASAETATAVALVLGALDAYGLRTLGVGDGLEPETFAAVSAAVLSVLSAAWARAFPLRLPRIAAVLIAQLPVLLLLARHQAGPGTTGLVLAGLCAADLAALHVSRSRAPRDVTVTALVAGLVVGSIGLLVAVGAAVATDVLAGVAEAATEQSRLGALALVAYATLAAGAALLGPATGRLLLSAVPVPLLGLAAYSLARDDLTAAQEPLVAAAVGLLAAQVAALLPRGWRGGPLSGALLVSAVGVGSQLQAVLEALAGPLGWLADPWSLPEGTAARAALAPDTVWSGSVVTLVVLVAAAATAVTAAAALHSIEQALVPAAILLVASAVLLPLGLATSYPVALVLILLVAGALAALGRAVVGRRNDVGVALTIAGLVAALIAVAWSLASEPATLAVLPTVVVLLAALSVVTAGPGVRDAAALLAALLAGATLAAVGAAQDLAADQVGGLLLAAPAALLGLSLLIRRVPLEVAAGVLALTSIVLAGGQAGWLTWTLALTGLLALALALRPDRRWAAGVGALLLAASSWVRLADAGVVSPEPYVVPLGLVALGLGHLRRRAAPETSSMAAYSTGLGLLLVPSLLYALGDDELLRPVLLLFAAAAVLGAGVAGRLRAPLVFGGAVLAVDALNLLAPYAAALPRWMPLAVLGLALVTFGATYEQRRKDLAGLRDRLDAFA